MLFLAEGVKIMLADYVCFTYGRVSAMLPRDGLNENEETVT
jgi:hypothetical protein